MKTLSATFTGILALGVASSVSARATDYRWVIGPIVDGDNSSIGMPLRPRPNQAGAVAFDFPTEDRGQVGAMTAPIAPLLGRRVITLRYRIDADTRTRFVAEDSRNEPATVSVYFQRRGDTWTARGRYASYRWYAPASAVIPLVPGVRTVTMRLDDQWTNVNGVPVSQDPAGFYAALRDTSEIGIAFGASSARSHGVFISGAARFTLLSLDIN